MPLLHCSEGVTEGMETELCAGSLRFVALVNDPVEQHRRVHVVLEKHLHCLAPQVLNLQDGGGALNSSQSTSHSAAPPTLCCPLAIQ